MQVNNNQSNGGFSMFKKVFGVMALASTMLLFVCDTDVGPVAVTKYTVTYNGNGNTGGTVPSDMNSYAQNAMVAVLDNTGSLAKTGFTFAGWNTAAAGNGTSYAAGTTFAMGAANITLFAKWTVVVPTVITDFRLPSNTVPGWTEVDTTVSPYKTGEGQLLFGPMNGGATRYVDGGAVSFSYQFMEKDTNGAELMIIDYGTAEKAIALFVNSKTTYGVADILPLGIHSIDSIGILPLGYSLKTFSYYKNFYFELVFTNYANIADSKKIAETFIAACRAKVK
jgi:uncharacterized repeat protein (TIGR02543 family)